jgi:hypothetical protein
LLSSMPHIISDFNSKHSKLAASQDYYRKILWEIGY